jgi:hypothetical protein
MILVQRAREKPPLPQAAVDSLLPIYVLDIARVHRLENQSQCPCQRRNADEVDMVGHETIRKDLQSKLDGVLEDELKVSLAICIAEENVISAIAPLSDMVRNSRYDNSRNSRHLRCSWFETRERENEEPLPWVRAIFPT